MIDVQPASSTVDISSEGELPESLAQAHRGYVYQDVATAYLCARAMFDGAEKVVVDKKEYEGDLFDDLTIVLRGHITRRQFKSHAPSPRPFDETLLRTKTRDLRIDDLVHCFATAADCPAHEYRICSTWDRPEDGTLAGLLQPCNVPSSFEGYATKCYRIDAASLWPEGGQFRWSLRGGQAMSRDHLFALCERLTIELECPQISLDVQNPGPLQSLLVTHLETRIGVGRYPNRHLRPVDAAVRLIYRASLARSRNEEFEPRSLLRDLGLRTDHGRVAQKFPVDESRFVAREEIANTLTELTQSRRRIGVIGPPGCGKSWLLTRLADERAAAGVIVARHYCYVEPHDEHRAERITTNAFWGNIVAEIADAVPGVRDAVVPRLSAGLAELQQALELAVAMPGHQGVLLIVDGLDHIGRVLAATPAAAPDEARIVDELASLHIPEGVCIVLGSQPGPHIDQLLAQDERFIVPGWDILAIRMLVLKFAFRCDFRPSAEVIHARSEGNPLYATYLCREIASALSAGRATDPLAVLSAVPQFAGELDRYYRYITEGIREHGVVLVFAVLEFAVTREELSQLFPLYTLGLDDILARLSPVLSDVAGTGGLRVYHDSFRGFLVDSLSRHEGARAAVLNDIVAWLSRRGFQNDGRAYRHMLPYLEVLGRCQEVITAVDTRFVSSSIASLHPEDAIAANIAVAARCAAHVLDLPRLCRLVELKKAVETCFRENWDYLSLVRASVAIDGPDRTAASLLLDGRPTRSRDEGLIACSLCDDAGGLPPWSEYLAAVGPRGLEDREDAALAAAHGRLRTTTVPECLEFVYHALVNAPRTHGRFVLALLKRAASVHGVPFLRKLADRTGLPTRSRHLLYRSIATVLNTSAHDAEEAASAADAASCFATSVEDVYECLRLGASPHCAGARGEIVEAVLADMLSTSYPDDALAYRWIAAVGVVASYDAQRVATLADTITIDGWYTAWLRFVTDVAIASELSKDDERGAERGIIAALERLATETNPFRGSPRACDLWGMREPIQFVFAECLRLATSSEATARVLQFLTHISRETTTSIQGTPGGPLDYHRLAQLIYAEARDSSRMPLFRRALEEQVERSYNGFYAIQAEAELTISAVLARGGDIAAARERLARGCECLAGYSQRKDITIFELTDSLEALGRADHDGAFVRAARMQPLVHSLGARTDGSETQHALIRWFETLFAIDETHATVLLAKSLASPDGDVAWRLEACLKTAVYDSTCNDDELELVSKPV